jgi:hypothetical protein
VFECKFFLYILRDHNWSYAYLWNKLQNIKWLEQKIYCTCNTSGKVNRLLDGLSSFGQLGTQVGRLTVTSMWHPKSSWALFPFQLNRKGKEHGKVWPAWSISLLLSFSWLEFSFIVYREAGKYLFCVQEK